MFPGLLTFCLLMGAVALPSCWSLFGKRPYFRNFYFSFQQTFNKLNGQHGLTSNHIIQSHQNKLCADIIIGKNPSYQLFFAVVVLFFFLFFSNGCMPWNSHIERKKQFLLIVWIRRLEHCPLFLYISLYKCNCQAMQSQLAPDTCWPADLRWELQKSDP